MSYFWPTLLSTITSKFGDDRYSSSKGQYHHTGEDIDGERGAPIFAFAPGRVAKIGYQEKGYGHYIDIDHGNGYVTRYAHLMERPDLEEGVQIEGGVQIAKMGNTGRSIKGTADGSHLHFEVRKDGAPVDPEPYLASAKKGDNAALFAQGLDRDIDPEATPAPEGAISYGVGWTKDVAKRPDVATMQDQLARAGFPCNGKKKFHDMNTGEPNGCDGKFGPATKAALIKFQESKGLEATGYLDEATQAELDKTSPRQQVAAERQAKAAVSFAPVAETRSKTSPGSIHNPPPQVARIIDDAARKAGLNPEYLERIAWIESRFNPNAVSPTGCTGLFQFCWATYKETLKHHGIAVSGDDRANPERNALAAAYHMKDNIALYKGKYGSDPSWVDLYLIHNIGWGAAQKFFNALHSNPDANARGVVGAVAADNNPLFYNGGKTIAESYGAYHRHMQVAQGTTQELAYMPAAPMPYAEVAGDGYPPPSATPGAVHGRALPAHA